VVLSPLKLSNNFQNPILLHLKFWPLISIAGLVHDAGHPALIATWCKVRTVWDKSNTGIVDSNAAWRIGLCPRFPDLCRPVYLEAL
jgi:hypothetical protein